MHNNLAHDGRPETLNGLRRILDRGYEMYTSDPVQSLGAFSGDRKPELVVIVLDDESGANVLQKVVAAVEGKATVLHLTDGSNRPRPPAKPPQSAAGIHLTPREREVIQLTVRGYSMKVIARLLNIAPRTVAFHKYKAMENNGLRNNADLVGFAAQHGLADLPYLSSIRPPSSLLIEPQLK